MPRKKIAVYTGPGTSTGTLISRLEKSFHAAAVRQMGARTLSEPETLDQDTLAFFLPGIVGEDCPYARDIGGEGNEAIRKYVEDGGVFVGICAGAYHACKDVLYDPPWRNTPKTRKPGLDFFNALAKGPLPGLGHESGKQRFSDCVVTTVSYINERGQRKTTGIAYGNGPALHPYGSGENIEVLARYGNAPDGPVAVAVARIGKGLAFFIGILPDIGYDGTQNLAAFPALQQLTQNLKQHEAGRAELWNMIVSMIKRHNADLGRVRLYERTRQPV